MEVLQVENIHKKIGKREIIKGVSFSVKTGEIFGFWDLMEQEKRLP